MKKVLVKVRHFGKVIALPFFTNIFIQNNAFLEDKKYCNRVEI